MNKWKKFRLRHPDPFERKKILERRVEEKRIAKHAEEVKLLARAYEAIEEEKQEQMDKANEKMDNDLKHQEAELSTREIVAEKRTEWQRVEEKSALMALGVGLLCVFTGAAPYISLAVSLLTLLLLHDNEFQVACDKTTTFIITERTKAKKRVDQIRTMTKATVKVIGEQTYRSYLICKLMVLVSAAVIKISHDHSKPLAAYICAKIMRGATVMMEITEERIKIGFENAKEKIWVGEMDRHRVEERLRKKIDPKNITVDIQIEILKVLDRFARESKNGKCYVDRYKTRVDWNKTMGNGVERYEFVEW